MNIEELTNAITSAVAFAKSRGLSSNDICDVLDRVINETKCAEEFADFDTEYTALKARAAQGGER